MEQGNQHIVKPVSLSVHARFAVFDVQREIFHLGEQFFLGFFYAWEARSDHILVESHSSGLEQEFQFGLHGGCGSQSFGDSRVFQSAVPDGFGFVEHYQIGERRKYRSCFAGIASGLHFRGDDKSTTSEVFVSSERFECIQHMGFFVVTEIGVDFQGIQRSYLRKIEITKQLISWKMLLSHSGRLQGLWHLIARYVGKRVGVFRERR